jgi:hypothetical protein
MGNLVARLTHIPFYVNDLHWSLGAEVVQQVSSIYKLSFLRLGEQLLLGNAKQVGDPFDILIKNIMLHK